MSKLLSVVIPTYNRCALLERALESLFAQTLDPEQFEVIVIDDGSTDDTERSLTALTARAPVSVQYRRQSNRGPGAARNRGMELAEGEHVLLFDDDVLAVPAFLEEHLRFHRLHPQANVAVAGNLPLAPDLPAEWRGRGQWWRDKWEKIADHEELDWTYFTACNISLKRRFILDEELWFDEDFPRAAYEDWELGYRAARRGLRIYYNEKAMAYHYMNLEFDNLPRRALNHGQGMAILHRKHPELRSEVGNSLIFSWRNSPGRIARDLVKPALRNAATVPLFGVLARASEGRSERLARFFRRQMYAYYERIGYLRARAEQAGERGS